MADLLQCSLTQPPYYIGTIDLRFESKVGHIYVCMYVSARYWSIDKMRANTHTYNYVYKWWSNAISIRDKAGQNRLINLMTTNTPNDHKDSPFLVPAILCRKFFFCHNPAIKDRWNFHRYFIQCSIYVFCSPRCCTTFRQ